MIQRFILALLVSLTLVAVGCSEEEKKSSTSDTGSTSGTGDGTSGATSGTGDGTSGATSGTDDTSGATSGTDDTSGSTSGTEDATADDTSGSTSGDTSGSTSGTTDLCQNTPDLDYLAGTVADGKHAGKTGREAAAAAAGTCGLANLAKPDPKAETIACMQGAPENIALTDGCAGCYGDIVACSITNCLAGGCTTPGSPACVACQEEKGCIAAFDACTGPLPE
jgi:hypothetical protein